MSVGKRTVGKGGGWEARDKGTWKGKRNVGEEGECMKEGKCGRVIECGRMDEGARIGIINEDRNNGLDMKWSVK